LPLGGGSKRKPSHVVISLGTPLLPRARLLGAQLNLIAELLTERLPMMTSEQINAVFRRVLLAQVAKLDCVVANESADATFNPRQSAQIDDQWHWAYRLLGTRGPYTEVDDDVAGQMRAAAVPEEDIYTVAVRLQQLRRAKMVPVPERKLEALLAAVDAEPTDGNLRIAQQTYFRAMAEAASLSARFQREGRPADAVLAQAILMQEAKAAAQIDPVATPREALQTPVPPATGPVQPPSTVAAAQPCTFENHPVWVAAEKLIAHNAEHRLWNTQGQN
jgi:hypothetical protein